MSNIANKIYCATLEGLKAKIIEVESIFTRGLPSFNITGLVSNTIKESQERVKSALNNSSIDLPPLKLNINLSPSDIPKNGSHFDLPIAILIIASKMKISMREWFAFGEVGLNGEIKSTNLIYPLLLDIILKKEHPKIILPSDRKDIYSKIPNLELYFAKDLTECIKIITGEAQCTKSNSDFHFKYINYEDKKFYYSDSFEFDFKDIKGQKRAIEAALIAACGFHNIIFEGSPGCGKSMIAKRMRYILPPLGLAEMIETVKIQSFNQDHLEYKPIRNFRNPHQSASKASILGSITTNNVRPGEVALANNGMIFFDELPYFDRLVLESLREPLENNQISVSRVEAKITYDTDFMFVAAMNPCPCGNKLNTQKECRCKDIDIAKYRQKLSEPFLDRIDLFIQMDEKSDDKAYFNSKSMQEIVFKTFIRQLKRNGLDKSGKVVFNSRLSQSQVDQICTLDPNAYAMLEMSRQNLGLSMRAMVRMIKLARTIADMDNSDEIKTSHILKAISYRKT